MYLCAHIVGEITLASKHGLHMHMINFTASKHELHIHMINFTMMYTSFSMILKLYIMITSDQC